MILINTTETIQIYKMEKKTIKKKKNATRNYIKKKHFRLAMVVIINK